MHSGDDTLRMDLLTVVRHELGHVLGYDHGDGLMAATLAAGESRSVSGGRAREGVRRRRPRPPRAVETRPASSRRDDGFVVRFGNDPVVDELVDVVCTGNVGSRLRLGLDQRPRGRRPRRPVRRRPPPTSDASSGTTATAPVTATTVRRSRPQRRRPSSGRHVGRARSPTAAATTSRSRLSVTGRRHGRRHLDEPPGRRASRASRSPAAAATTRSASPARWATSRSRSTAVVGQTPCEGRRATRPGT